MIIGLTASLIKRHPGHLEITYREMQGLALKPAYVAKLIAADNKDAELNAVVAELPACFHSITNKDAPWEQVLHLLTDSNAVDTIGGNSSLVLSPGPECDALVSQFGTLPDDYMHFVDLAIQAYQSTSVEELAGARDEIALDLREQWLSETTG